MDGRRRADRIRLVVVVVVALVAVVAAVKVITYRPATTFKTPAMCGGVTIEEIGAVHAHSVRPVSSATANLSDQVDPDDTVVVFADDELSCSIQ